MHWRKKKGLSHPCPSRMSPLPLITVEPVATTPPAASPCADGNIGRSRSHRAEEDAGTDKRLISRVRRICDCVLFQKTV